MKQERHFCRECKREWLVPTTNYVNSSPCSITGNPINGGNCPVCGSPELEIVQYTPQYAGLDIPRDETGLPVPIGMRAQKPIEVIPSLTGTNSLNIYQTPSPLLFQAIMSDKSEAILEVIPEPPDYFKTEYGE